MAGRWSQIAVIAGVVLVSPAARAEQEVKLGALEMTIFVPDEWEHAYDGKVDSFTHREEGYWIGGFSSPNNTCAVALPVLREASAVVADDLVPLENWSGFDSADGDDTTGMYCRDTGYGQIRFSVIVSGPTTVVLPLLRAVSEGVDRIDAVWAKFKPKDRPEGTATTATEDAPRRWLPFTIEPSLQTIKVDERGYGGRVAVAASRTLGRRFVLGARGEVGYDSVAKLSYDAAVRAAVRLGVLSAIGHVGRDQLGTDDVESIAGAWYNGIGASLGLYDRDGHASIEVALLRRSGHDAELEPPDPRRPFAEIRVRAEVTWKSSSPVTGLTADFRMIGDARVGSLGFLLAF